MTSSPNLILSSNWQTLGDKELKNVVSSCSSEKKEINVDDVTSLESCVCLTRQSNSETKPEIKIKLDALIMQIDIISEAQVIELFGTSDEYLSTSHAEFIDDWEDMSVYHGKIIMPNIPMCSLKLTRIREKDRCWIYGIGITISESSSNSKITRFNFDNVNKLVEKSSHQISEKAEKFKNFLQLHSKDPRMIPPQLLLNILQDQYGLQLQDCKKMLLNRFGSLQLKDEIPDLQLKNEISDSKLKNEISDSKLKNEIPDLQLKNEISDSKLKVKSSGDSNEELKTYIDEKLNQIKSEILSEFEIRLKEVSNLQNQKLDRIIKLLGDEKFHESCG